MDIDAPDLESYCRSLEAYLCRKNDGHLIRIVGPAFEQVCGWAARGIPVKVAERGIDRYFERYYAKGPRRRPVRIEFCEADVFDVFDEWRRAVGLPIREVPEASGHHEPDAYSRRGSLPAHLERVIARLTAVRAGEDTSLDDVLERFVRELDAARAGAKALRGDARSELLERLRAMDVELIERARQESSAVLLTELEREAEAELAPFHDRMPPDAYQHSLGRAIDRLVRERRKLPIVAFE